MFWADIASSPHLGGTATMARMSKADRERRRQESVAYHEAGHAVMGFELGIGVRRVSIVADGKEGSLGHVLNYRRPTFRPEVASFRDHKTLGRAEQMMLVLLAGAAAEIRFTGLPHSAGDGNDRSQIQDLADRFCTDEDEADKFIDWLTVRARNLIERPELWAQVEALARALLAKPTLGTKEAKQICLSAYIDKLGPGAREAFQALNESISPRPSHPGGEA